MLIFWYVLATFSKTLGEILFNDLVTLIINQAPYSQHSIFFVTYESAQ
jgi:hypothetical protein